MTAMNFQSKGGKARAKSLTPERRSAIASAAGNARWHGNAKQSLTLLCSSRISPRCLKEIVVVVASDDQAHRVLIKLNWNILADHARVYGYVCPHCVQAHAPCAERVEKR